MYASLCFLFMGLLVYTSCMLRFAFLLPSFNIIILCLSIKKKQLWFPQMDKNALHNFSFLTTLRDSSVGPALGLLPNGHQFESPQGHWRFIRSLTSGPRGISRGVRKLTRTSTVIKNKKIKKIHF